MSERKAARESYDALVDICPGGEYGSAYALVKQSYSMGPAGLSPAAPEPLQRDIRDPEDEVQFKAGSDFYPVKAATDFVVRGAAFGPAPEGYMEVSISVGAVNKRIAVFGRREITWPGGTVGPQVGRPEPFEVMPLCVENAYGGVDFRVLLDEADRDDPFVLWTLVSDHPGLYPRNPFGKGYLVLGGPPDDKTEMPNLEDPDDLLTADRLVLGDPRRWYGQPLPWCPDWTHPASFPRCVYFRAQTDPWFPAPEDRRLPEVARGFLAAGYRREMEQRPHHAGPHPRFFQEASAGLVLSGIRGGEPVTLVGMHRHRRSIRFSLPRPPALLFTVERNSQPVQPRLHHVVCQPAEELVHMVYGARRELPRAFLPGIHAEIPVSITVDGDAPVAYETPPTFKQLAQADKKPRRRRKRRPPRRDEMKRSGAP